MRGVALFTAIVLLLSTIAIATLLAGSRLETCVRDGSDALSAQLSCSKKFTVTIALNNGQNNTESIEATVDSAVDANGNIARLEYPMIITLQKSQGLWNYPLDYRVDVNSKPIEQIVYVPNSLFVPQCVDSDAAQSPTCGWYTNAQGQNVPHSQGFCCACSFAQVIGVDQSSTRAGLNCAVISGQSSAHCLRRSDLWYSVFGIGPVETSFDIVVTLYQQTATGLETQQLQLSPSRTGQINSDKTVIAKLVGDFSAWTSPPALANKFLLVPSQPASHTRNYMDYSIVVDGTRITFDGSERNKIGVGFEAFRYEPNPCNNQRGSSLRNQIDDLVQEDLDKRSRGVTGNYLLSNYGAPQLKVDEAGRRLLAYTITQTVASVVTLQIAADNIRFIVNSSPGEIITAEANSFESLSRSGRLVVLFQNTGSIAADYEVAVTDCSTGIAAVQSQQATVNSQQQKLMTFIVNGDNLFGGNKQCTVRLLDSQQYEVDSVIVQFNTTTTSISRGAQDGEAADDSGRVFGSQSNAALTCDDYCPMIVDIPCFVIKGCWSKLLIIAAIVVGVIVFIIILRKCACMRKACRCCCCWPCMLCKAAKKNRDKRASKAKRREKKYKLETAKGAPTSVIKPVVQKAAAQLKQLPQSLSAYLAVEQTDSDRSDHTGDSDSDVGVLLPQRQQAAYAPLTEARSPQPRSAQPSATRVSVQELDEIAGTEGLVYLHLQNSDNQYSDALNVSTNERFSLLGILSYNVVDDEQDVDAELPFVFEVPGELSVQRWRLSSRTGRYVSVQPLSFDAEAFAFELSEREALRGISVIPRHGYKCLNEPRRL